MGALPRGLPATSICAIVLFAAVVAHAAVPETASTVVGLAKCADCTRKNMNAEAVFKGLHVALKCKNAKGEFETKAVAKVDKSGAFSVPLAADLLRPDGELKQDCFTQLQSASSHQPCPGQEPSWVVRPSSLAAADDTTTFVAVAGKLHYSSKECASAFLCDPFHKKHHLLHKIKPVVVPHVVHKKPAVVVVPPHPDIHHKKPVPVPEYSHPTPVPTYKPPTVPEYSHHPSSPTPIYHPPAVLAEQKAQNPETDPEKFKKLLPFIKKNPFLFPKFKKFPPGKVETKA